MKYEGNSAKVLLKTDNDNVQRTGKQRGLFRQGKKGAAVWIAMGGRIALIVSALAGFGLSEMRAAKFPFFRDYWGDVLVATDTTEEGHARATPSPDHPVYYVGRSLGCRLGSIPGDLLPDSKAMTDMVVRVLAKQGYRGAQPNVHEPSLLLVVQWGYLSPRTENLLWFLGYNAADDIAAPVFPGKLGPEIFRRNMRSHLVETILDNASDAVYGIIVTAFDYRTARGPSPKILWQTRISLPANGKSMAEALPVMLTAAGPSIGRESDKSILADADAAREGRVDLGELKALDIVSDRAMETGSREKK